MMLLIVFFISFAAGFLSAGLPRKNGRLAKAKPVEKEQGKIVLMEVYKKRRAYN